MQTYSSRFAADAQRRQIMTTTGRHIASPSASCLSVAIGVVCVALITSMGVADDAAPASGAAAEEPADAPLPLPEGGVDELVKHIAKWRAFRPQSQADMERYTRARKAVSQAAYNILEIEKDQASDAFKLAMRIVLQNRIDQTYSQTKNQQRTVYEDVKAFLMSHELEEADGNLALQITTTLGYQNEELAIEAATALAPRLAASSNEKLQKTAEMMKGMVRRLNLKDNEMVLSGKTMEGQPFDLASLRGKVVLVDFWATWCGACRKKVPNVKKNYEAYHAQGFEVVGVSVDEDRTALEKYVEEEKMPWITLHDYDGSGGGHPAAIYYGIRGIPTMILVGKDGKVLSTEARGEHLDKLLAEQFKTKDEGQSTNDKGQNDER